ncbi:hypothetical protein JOM56_001681 [Amanita muscaria]
MSETPLHKTDVLTLPNRLKSYTTAQEMSNQILSETASLRAQLRMLLEDEKTAVLRTTPLERNQMVARMRALSNDVILDLTEAGKISEAAMDPNKVIAAVGKHGLPGSGFLGCRSHAATRSRTIAVPKIAAALCASATTVNVEFLGAGMYKGKDGDECLPAMIRWLAAWFKAVGWSPAMQLNVKKRIGRRRSLLVLDLVVEAGDQRTPWISSSAPFERRKCKCAGGWGTLKVICYGCLPSTANVTTPMHTNFIFRERKIHQAVEIPPNRVFYKHWYMRIIDGELTNT